MPVDISAAQPNELGGSLETTLFRAAGALFDLVTERFFWFWRGGLGQQRDSSLRLRLGRCMKVTRYSGTLSKEAPGWSNEAICHKMVGLTPSST